MLKKLKKIIESTLSISPDSEPDDKLIKLASATLMFEVIKSDDEILDDEIAAMANVLSTHFELNQADIDGLIEQAKLSSEDAISLQGFTRTICDNWTNEQRCQLVENCWIIAFADNKIDMHERHVIRKIAGLLYLTDKQIILARQSAKSKLSVD